MVGYIAHVLIELWRPITFEPIFCLSSYIVIFVQLSETKVSDRFKSYGPPKFYKDMGYITDHYVITG